MTKAKGVVQAFEPSQVSGIDERVWQEKGTSTDNRGVYFSLRGEVATVEGIRPLTRHWELPYENNPTASFFTDPFLREITSIGTFSRHGCTDILVECNGKIMLIQGPSAVDLVTDRHIPVFMDEATRFIQVADNLIIINGHDPNLKWDGEKITPLGIAGAPEAPEAVGGKYGDGAVAPVSPRAGTFWSGASIKKTGTVVKYKYKAAFINEFGQRSELSGASNAASDAETTDGHEYLVLVANLEAGSSVQDDIIGRELYRSVDGVTYHLIRYLPGSDGDTYFDFTEPSAPLSVTADPPGDNNPPPWCSWGFYFRGRTYYGGSPENPTVLYFSKDKGGKEAVPAGNFIIVGSNAADKLTGWAISGDFALIFKERSTYMLTQSKDGEPILTPISSTIGAVSDRAAAGFEGKVFFVSESGLYAFDGSKILPISKNISEVIKKAPRATLRNAVSWVDPAGRKVYISIPTGPTAYNNEVWVIHADNGALSRIEASVTCAVSYKGMTLVGYNSTSDNDGVNDIGVWGCGTQVYYKAPSTFGTSNYGNDRPDPILRPKEMLARAMRRKFETRWMYGSSPQADKTFYRIDVFYAQTGGYQAENKSLGTKGFDNRIYVKWFTDWNRNIVGEEYLTPSDPSALMWDEALLNDAGSQTGPVTWLDVSEPELHKLWDEKRVRCKKINIRVTDRIDPLNHLTTETRPVSPVVNTASDESGSHLTAKSLKVSFSGGGDAGWRIVGFLLHMKDHGIRGEGTDSE